MAIEVLSPAKLFSKTFQSEDVDSVEAKNSVSIQGKKFEKLSLVNYFFKEVKVVERKHVFQDVVLTHVEQGRDTAKNKKDV